MKSAKPAIFLPLVPFCIAGALLTPAHAAPPRATPLVQSERAPVQVVRKADGHYFIDFGKAWFGTALLDFPRPENGRRVTIRLGEARRDATTVDPKPGGSVRFQEHVLTLRDGATRYRIEPTWAPPGWMKEGWIPLPEWVGKVMPFRYVEVLNAPEPFTAANIRQLVVHVPFNDDAAHFTSSSPVLNDIWAMCKHTIKATSFTGLYVDGDRERKPYEADVYINQLAHYCLDLHHETTRHTHEYLLAQPTWPTEWRLQSVLIGWADYLYSGDGALLRKHYATLKQRCMIERRDATGLFVGFDNKGDPRDIVDWPVGERDGYDMTRDVKTVVTAFHFHALELMERIARVAGNSKDAAAFARLAAQTKAAVNEKLWDVARGCYLDGLDSASGVRSANASLHANLFPLAFGLVPEARQDSVVAYIKSRGMACSVYGAQFLLDGLYGAGAADYALSLLTSTNKRSWANMIYNVGSTMALEAWDAEFKPNLDWNHAWGAAPASVIPRKLMGVEPTEPGFKRIRIRPQLASLEYAALTMPTPRGALTLDVRQPSGGDWTARVAVPVGSVADMRLPTGDVKRVWVNGQSAARLPRNRVLTVWQNRIGIVLPAGPHELRVNRAGDKRP